MYLISCLNQWCSGPKNYRITDDLPNSGEHCPVCGWLALPGSGIQWIADTTQNDTTDEAKP